MSQTYIDFRNAIGFKESSNRYTIVNQLGYLGRYQFGLARLTDFGLCVRKVGTTGFGNEDFDWVPPFNQNNFLASPALQDACFDHHAWLYQEWVYYNYGLRCGKVVNGVLFTASGGIACCHLLGPGGLESFFHGVVEKDANGETATDYMTQFGGYSCQTMNPPSGTAYFQTLIAKPAVVQAPVIKVGFWGRVLFLLRKLFL